jgi:tetratricopeptide (TPR) repeat protein
VEAYDYLGQVALDAGDPRAARENFEKGLSMAPSNPGLLVGLAGAHIALGENDQAMAAFTKALECPQMPSSMRASCYLNRGEHHFNQKNYAAAVSDFSRAIEVQPFHAWYYLRRGVAHFYLKHYEQALDDFAKTVELGPDDGSNLWWIPRKDVASCPDEKFRTGLLAIFSKSVELNPKHAGKWMVRGMAYHSFRQYDKAIADYTKAIELDPKSVWFLVERAVAYSRLHQYDKVLADYTKAIELDPKNVPAWNNRGVAYQELHQYDKALADYSKAIELDPKNAMFWHNRAHMYENIGKSDKALADFSQAMVLEPKNAKHWSCRGHAYAGLQQYDKALADLNKAIELDPKNASALNALAWFLATYPEPKVRDPRRAVEAAKKAVELARPRRQRGQRRRRFLRRRRWRQRGWRLGRRLVCRRQRHPRQ